MLIKLKVESLKLKAIYACCANSELSPFTFHLPLVPDVVFRVPDVTLVIIIIRIVLLAIHLVEALTANLNILLISWVLLLLYDYLNSVNYIYSCWYVHRLGLASLHINIHEVHTTCVVDLHVVVDC